ncbi:MAG: UDP-N-acetyl-D-mannosamine dehydrogenase [Chloroflexi bacterium]|nr:UDP-N-acetyl-D-mannosamine dehydrogenase [Chloroflexota bacterium]
MLNRPSVCVVGLGYIGLPTAAMLANSGHAVVGVDINADVVDTINGGRVHIVEPDLAALVGDVVRSGSLSASTEPVAADVFLICVPTPFAGDAGTPTPDISHVLAAARSIARVLVDGNLVIIESTCPVGTTELIRDELAAQGVQVDRVRLAYCPERVLPGRILHELVSNDRIVGGIDEASSAAAAAFYRTFVKGSVPTTSSRTAEMVKLVENSFRDVNIAFANEISVLSEHLAIDPWEVIRLANRHPRVDILQPGPGVGGHCIAVDPWFVVAKDPATARLVRTAREVNDAKTEWVIAQVRATAAAIGAGLPRPVRVACLGLAYKPDVDDLRESPALRVALSLAAAGIEVLACEPHLTEHPLLKLYLMEDAVSESDLVVALVRHSQFIGLSFGDRRVLDYCGLTASATPA